MTTLATMPSMGWPSFTTLSTAARTDAGSLSSHASGTVSPLFEPRVPPASSRTIH